MNGYIYKMVQSVLILLNEKVNVKVNIKKRVFLALLILFLGFFFLFIEGVIVKVKMLNYYH